jgi:hypothetical protein
MKKFKVISVKNLPAKLPLSSTLIAFLFLDRFHAPAWLWGALGSLYLIVWILIIARICNQKSIDILEDQNIS